MVHQVLAKQKRGLAFNYTIDFFNVAFLPVVLASFISVQSTKSKGNEVELTSSYLFPLIFLSYPACQAVILALVKDSLDYPGVYNKFHRLYSEQR
mmetsp:Transcript_35394/g.54173  ORF Transcript_35394/g.54173 Transcript_35394/m.54173 type:complete len:95 (-) Transcript_35394:175-459(-)